MHAPSAEIVVGVDILSTTRDATTGSVLAQLGSVATETVISDRAELWQQCGIISRPPKPTAKQTAAQACYLSRGDTDVIVATRDLRGQSLAATLEDGETCVYAAGSDGNAQGRVLCKANGNVAMYTAQGNVAGGNSVTIQANADGSITMGGPYGGITIDSAGIKIVSATGAAIQLNAQGITLIGQGIALNGASVSLGANAVLPVIYGPTGVAGVASTSVKVAV